MSNKPTRSGLANRWISIEYEDKSHKAKWYKGLVKKYCTQTDRYLIAWETGGQDWVDELKDNEYKMAKPPGSSKSHAPLKRKRTVKEAKILVYGLPGSGKTSIINKLAELSGQRNSSEQGVAPTHMFDVSRLYWGGTGSDVKLTVFDFGGREAWRRSLWKDYYNQADALVWVVDSTDRRNLEMCRNELLDLLDCGVLDGVCLLLYANKLDLEQQSPLDVNEIADSLGFQNQANKLLQERLWHIQSCSATTGDGLKDGMDWLVEKVKTPIQRDAEFYYTRAAEGRFLGPAGTPAFKDADEDLNKAIDLSKQHLAARGSNHGRQQQQQQEPDRAAHQELQQELQRAKDAKRGKGAYLVRAR